MPEGSGSRARATIATSKRRHACQRGRAHALRRLSPPQREGTNAREVGLTHAGDYCRLNKKARMPERAGSRTQATIAASTRRHACQRGRAPRTRRHRARPRLRGTQGLSRSRSRLHRRAFRCPTDHHAARRVATVARRLFALRQDRNPLRESGGAGRTRCDSAEQSRARQNSQWLPDDPEPFARGLKFMGTLRRTTHGPRCMLQVHEQRPDFPLHAQTGRPRPTFHGSVRHRCPPGRTLGLFQTSPGPRSLARRGPSTNG